MGDDRGAAGVEDPPQRRRWATLTVEVDVYAGDLEGLLTAEVEFPDEATAREFSAPEWLGRDVTDDERYANRALAVNGIP